MQAVRTTGLIEERGPARCVFHANSAADSTRNRPLIPWQIGHSLLWVGSREEASQGNRIPCRLFNDDARRDLPEILDDRRSGKSIPVTRQFPIDTWHDYIGEPTLADAILDRLVHNAYRLNLKGESKNLSLTTTESSE